jgi:hypothetical protein
VRRPKILNLRSNQNSATYPKFPNYLHPLRHLRRPCRCGSLRRCLRRCLRCRLRRHRRRIFSARRSGCGGHQARLRRSLGASLRRPQRMRGHPARLPQSPGVAPGRPRTRPPPGSAPGQAARCSTPQSHPPSRHAPPKTQHTNSAKPHIAHIEQTPNKRQTLPEPSPSRPAP